MVFRRINIHFYESDIHKFIQTMDELENPNHEQCHWINSTAGLDN